MVLWNAEDVQRVGLCLPQQVLPYFHSIISSDVIVEKPPMNSLSSSSHPGEVDVKIIIVQMGSLVVERSG